MGLSPCRLVVPVKGSKRSRLPLPWGHAWSFPGFVVFKNNSRVIITHSRRQGQAPCSGGRTFPSAAPTSPCAFRDVPGTAPSLQHLRPTWAASCPVLPLRTRLCRSFVRAVGSHPSRKPAPAGASVSPRRVDPGALSSASSSALLGASAGGAQGTGPWGSAGSRPHLATRTPCRITPLRREPRGAWLADVAPAAARGRGDLRPPCAGGGRPRVVVFPVVLHVCRVVVRRARKSGRHAPVLFL